MKKAIILVLLFLLSFNENAYSHSGRTNAAGCHNNRKTGGYHCHNKKFSLPRVTQPVQTPPPEKPQEKEVVPESDLWEVPIQFQKSNTETKSKKPNFEESDFRDYICAKLGGRTEYSLDDGSRIDCLTEANAIEVDWAKKWSEAIGQSLYYSSKTGKQAGIVLIISNPDERRHLEKIKQVAISKSLDIKLWTIQPEALLNRVQIITKTTPLRVRSDPSPSSLVIGNLPSGGIFSLLGETEGWWKIEYQKGKSGWIPKKYSKKLE